MCLLWFIHFHLIETLWFVVETLSFVIETLSFVIEDPSFVFRQSHFERAPNKGAGQPYQEQEFHCYQKLKPPHSRSITCNQKCYRMPLDPFRHEDRTLTKYQEEERYDERYDGPADE